jgi:hypothetical protein
LNPTEIDAHRLDERVRQALERACAAELSAAELGESTGLASSGMRPAYGAALFPRFQI